MHISIYAIYIHVYVLFLNFVHYSKSNLVTIYHHRVNEKKKLGKHKIETNAHDAVWWTPDQDMYVKY